MAIDRYDGVMFRVLRKWRAHVTSPDLHIVIISAKYGLLRGDELIPNYEQHMTRARADELRQEVNALLHDHVRRWSVQSVFLGLGNTYRRVVDTRQLCQKGLLVQCSSGSIGTQAAQLKDWLWGETMHTTGGQSSARTTSPSHNRPIMVQLRGKEFSFIPEEVMTRARSALAINSTGADNFTSWYALIDDHRVSAKWLVRTISGLPLGAFSTSDARRVLAQLGIATHYAYAEWPKTQHASGNS